MSTYREPIPKPERGRSFFSPLCGPKTEQVDEEWPAVDSMIVQDDRGNGNGHYRIPPVDMPQQLPDANRNYDWFSFPTYSEMLQRRVYIPGHKIIEHECGYPEDLLRFRKEKDEELKLASSIQNAEFGKDPRELYTASR